MRHLTSNHVRSAYAKVSLLVLSFVNILLLIFSSFSYFKNSELDTDAIFYQSSLMVNSLVYIAVFFTIVSVILFMLWFKRAYANLYFVDSSCLSYKDGWTIGSWFVPVLNLYLPYKLMLDMFNGTNIYLRLEYAHSGRLKNTFIYCSWFFYIICMILGIWRGINVYILEEGSDTLIMLDYMISTLTFLSTTLLYIFSYLIVKTYSKTEILIIKEENRKKQDQRIWSEN